MAGHQQKIGNWDKSVGGNEDKTTVRQDPFPKPGPGSHSGFVRVPLHPKREAFGCSFWRRTSCKTPRLQLGQRTPSCASCFRYTKKEPESGAKSDFVEGPQTNLENVAVIDELIEKKKEKVYPYGLDLKSVP